ncbi:TPA: glycosyltransferase family 2 protein [Raoultella ornithinolytica]|uniref:glycosyltransferase family 2 protein n=2 Tax=Raoultella ornithinolytica TaxID=54291 RepID=UPI001F34125E
MVYKKIDVILACYNGEKFIDKQIRSILASLDATNGYMSRVLIADDGSNDNTISIISEIKDERVVLIDSTRVGGVIKNFSRLINYSDADYVFFSDQDDVWLQEKISVFMNRFIALEKECSNTPILLHSDVTLVDAELNLLNASMMNAQKIISQPSFAELLVSNSITGCAMAVNRPLLNTLTTLSDDRVVMHDWYLALIAKYFGILDLIPGSFVLYRQHGGNQVGSKIYGIRGKISPQKLIGFLRTSHRNVERSLAQAHFFYSQYKTARVATENKNDLTLYVSSSNSMLSKIKVLSSGRFRKMGKVRNFIYKIIYLTM